MVGLVGAISKGENLRLLYNIPQFLSPKDCDHIQEYIFHIEKDILAIPSAPNDTYTGTTAKHGKYNFFERVEKDLDIPLPTLIRDLIYDFFPPENTHEIWVKSWCNLLRQSEEIPIHYHGVDPDNDPHEFISGNIFLSNNNQPNPWYTRYETYGNIINEQGTLSLISSYLGHAVDPNNHTQPRYSCAFDVWFTKPYNNREEREIHNMTYWNRDNVIFPKSYVKE